MGNFFGGGGTRSLNLGSLIVSRSAISPSVAPVFTLQPQSQTVDEYATATFTAAATDATSYQWSKNASNVGTDSTSYSFAATAADNGAVVNVTATGAGGSTVSSNATLTVVSYIYNFDGTTQHAKLSSVVQLVSGDTFELSFKSPVITTRSDAFFLSQQDVLSSFYFKYNVNSGTPYVTNLISAISVISMYIDGNAITSSTNLTSYFDDQIHTLKVVVGQAVGFDIVAASRVLGQRAKGGFSDLKFTRAAGNIYVPFNNKSQGAVQVSASGAVNATIVNYNAAGWLVV